MSEKVVTITNAPHETDQHLKALHAEISRIACSFSNPVYRYGFERAASKALSDSCGSQPEATSGEVDPKIGASPLHGRISKLHPTRGSTTYKAWTKKRLNHNRHVSKQFFGTIHVERETYILQLCGSENLAVAPDTYQYMYQTSFVFHPAA